MDFEKELGKIKDILAQLSPSVTWQLRLCRGLALRSSMDGIRADSQVYLKATVR